MDPEEEEADWEPPDLPDASELPDNTGEWWVFYCHRKVAPPRAWPLALGITREISAPWRRGVGISVSWARNRATVGFWWRGPAPNHLVEPPPTNLRKVLGRAKRYRARYDNDHRSSNVQKVKE